MAPSTRRTPARNTRSRANAPSELPPIPLGLSTAYGAAGRPELAMPDNSGLLSPLPVAEALRRAQRGNRKTASPSASQEEDEEILPAQPSPVRRRKAREMPSRNGAAGEEASSNQNGIPTLADYNHSNTASSLVNDGTSIAQAMIYTERSPQPRPGRASQPGAERKSPSTQPLSEDSPDEPSTAAQPWEITVLLHSIPRYLKNAVNRAFHIASSKWAIALAVLLLLSSLLGVVDLPELPRNWVLRRARIARGARLMLGMEEFERAPSKYEQAWHYFRYQYMLTEDDFTEWNMPEMQWAYNLQFLQRIQDLEKRTATLEESVAALTTQIREDLPAMTVVQVENGEFRVPDGFWLALHAKMTGDESLWSTFLKANEANLREYTNQVVNDQLALGEKSSTVVGRVMLEEIIRENYDQLLKDFHTKMDLEHKDLVSHVSNVASKVAADLIARHTAGQIPVHQRVANKAGAAVVSNYVDELQAVNWFSIHHGARIDDSLTSPTAIRGQRNWLSKKYAEWYYPSNKPHTALRAWKEVTEAWCAAKSSSVGKAQIGILTSEQIIPNELIIEHIPRTGTLEIATAPRDVELWMNIGNDDTVNKLKQAIKQEVSPYNQPDCGESPPGPGWICAGRGRYDIHADNWVQHVPTMEILDTYHIKSNKWIVRATSNWGGDHTCFYRLRLTSEL